MKNFQVLCMIVEMNTSIIMKVRCDYLSRKTIMQNIRE